MPPTTLSRSDRRFDVDRVARLAGNAALGVLVLALLATFMAATRPPPRSSPGGVGNSIEGSSGPPVKASLVRTISSRRWFRPSPDPSGIAFQPASGAFIVVDSEVDETRALFRGSNVWMTDHLVHPTRSWSTIRFSSEPSDVAVAPHRRLVFTDDGTDELIFIDKGRDRTWGTSDDVTSSLPASAYGVGDPEGLTFGDDLLFIADGDGAILEVDPATRGFDGTRPVGDDVVRVLDVSGFGLGHLEGIAYDADTGSLFVVDREGMLVQIQPDERTLHRIDVTEVPMVWPAGITLGPGSRDASATHLYIAARGVDNGTGGSANDGRIFELALI